jgi:hypothetical protein
MHYRTAQLSDLKAMRKSRVKTVWWVRFAQITSENGLHALQWRCMAQAGGCNDEARCPAVGSVLLNLSFQGALGHWGAFGGHRGVSRKRFAIPRTGCANRRR